ncbi:MAG: hypothetical protein GEU28_09340 [Dehalococcoidia bacterium]|nr:hypothetical protein [Dehalococcoidia bacterium]
MPLAAGDAHQDLGLTWGQRLDFRDDRQGREHRRRQLAAVRGQARGQLPDHGQQAQGHLRT